MWNIIATNRTVIITFESLSLVFKTKIDVIKAKVKIKLNLSE